MTEDYRDKLSAALEFQDFVTVQLYKEGIIVNQLGSRKYQAEYGESVSGIEIKYDRRFRDTGNFYIEYQEKSDPNNPYYVDSGILRNDNTWLWVIGDYNDLYILPKASLVRLYKRAKGNKERAKKDWGIQFRQINTSMGFTVPVSFIADRFCAKHIALNDNSNFDIG